MTQLHPNINITTAVSILAPKSENTMHKNQLYCGLAIILLFTEHCYCSEVHNGINAEDIDYLSERSDAVVRAHVLSVQPVRMNPKIENGIISADVFSYGRLATLRPIEILWQRTGVSSLSSRFYIFQEGASPSLEQARLSSDAEFILFLKGQKVPQIATSGIATSPEMSSSNYYDIVGMRRGCIPVCDTTTVSRIKTHYILKY